MIKNHHLSVYNRNAWFYDSFIPETGFQRVPPALAAHIQKQTPDVLTPKARILDFGCGTGALSRALFKRHADIHITGAEPAHDMIVECKNKMQDQENFQLVGGCYDGHRLPFASASFDLVASSGVFDHLPMNKRLAAEFLRIVKPGGVLAFSYKSGGCTTSTYPKSERYYTHAPKHVRHCLEAAGAHVLKTNGACHFYSQAHLTVCSFAIARKPV